MTEVIATTAIQETPLTQYLASGQATAPAPYLGTLTLQQLDAIEVETEALLSGAAVHDLGWLQRIAVRGEDRFRWLSGMVTNEVETLADQHGAYNFILNAQGRIQGDAVAWRSGDALELEIAANQTEALLAHLDHFIIMDDVELLPLPGWTAIGLTGPEAERVLAAVGLPAPETEMTFASGLLDGFTVRVAHDFGPVVPHYALWIEADRVGQTWERLIAAGAKPAGSAALETLRIVEGVPAYGIDIQSRDLAQETSQMRALSFTKGCYLGQEIVERIRSRGQVHRHLRALEVSSETAAIPSAGMELRVSGSDPGAKPAGSFTSIAALRRNGELRIFAIAMIRAEAEAGGKPLSYDGGTAQILFSRPKGI